MGAVTYWFEDQTLDREDYTSCSGRGDVLVRRSDSIERTTLVVVGGVTYWLEDQTLNREDYTSCSGCGDVWVRRSDIESRGLQ